MEKTITKISTSIYKKNNKPKGRTEMACLIFLKGALNMENKLTLTKPVLVNGKPRKELKYDISKITGEQFIEADVRAHEKAARLGKPSLAVAETDDSLQLYLGMMAVTAVEPEVDVMDLERITGSDIMALYRIGRNFIKGSAEEEESMENPGSEENNSEEHTEDMPEHSIQESEN